MEIKILYGSESGTCYFEAQTFAIELKKLKTAKITLQSLNNYNFESIITTKILIILVSTTGQGEFPRNAREFWDNLLIDFPLDILQNLKFTIFGFGDSSYANFNTPSLLLNYRLKQLGGEEIEKIVLGDDSKDSGYFEDLEKWKGNIIKKLFNLDNYLLGREYLYDILYTTHDIYKSYKFFDFYQFFKDKKYLVGKVLNSELISDKNHFQEIYSLTFEIPEDIKYIPGDLVSIYYINPDEKIDKLLPMINSSQFLIKENKNYQEILNSKVNNKIITTKNLLKYIFDIQKPPNFYFIKALKFHTTGIYREKIEEMTFEDYYDYVIKEKREIYDILFDFKIKKIPLSIIINNYPFIRPRQYSISSCYSSEKRKLEIVYNVVEYKTQFKREIKGICTNYLKNLKKNDKICIKIEKGLFQYDKYDKPILMISTGTGLAPFLSLLREMKFREKLNKNKNVLIFGCRYKNKDFIKKKFLEGLQDENLLKCFFAFSREQKQKFYVQHFFEKEKKFFLEFFKKFFDEINIYVCGNSKFLALSIEKGIKKILMEIFEDEEKVDKIVKNWIKEKRLCYELYS